MGTCSRKEWVKKVGFIVGCRTQKIVQIPKVFLVALEEGGLNPLIISRQR